LSVSVIYLDEGDRMTTPRDVAKTLLHSITANTFVRNALLNIARTSLLPEQVWRRIPFEGTFRVSLPGGSGFTCQAIDADGVINRALFWRGWLAYEPETTLTFFRLAQRSNLILDIGANTGFFTLLACAANSRSKVIAFEPVPPIRERLLSHLVMNGWDGRCEARCEAVADFVGTTKLHVPFSMGIPTSASLSHEGFRGYEGSLIDVPVTTVDTVCSSGERVDLVKLDVENHEHTVLEGMKQVLSTSRPALIVECNPDGPFQAIEAILSQFGYDFFHLRPEGLVQCGRILPDETELYRNFLCIADSAEMPLLWSEEDWTVNTRRL
jgi:FkbM family methyltransferase